MHILLQYSWVRQVSPVLLLQLPGSSLESSAGEDALARRRETLCKQFLYQRENRLNSLFQTFVPPKNSGPFFFAPRGPKLLGFVEHFVGGGYYSYDIMRLRKGWQRKGEEWPEVLQRSVTEWKVKLHLSHRTPALSSTGVTAFHEATWPSVQL